MANSDRSNDPFDRKAPWVYRAASMQFVHVATEAPAGVGAYALLVALDAPLLACAGRRSALLAPGRYIYCGSARGPGGLRARLGRHMRRGKRRRWHIDQLTEAGRVLGAWIAPDGDECALVGRSRICRFRWRDLEARTARAAAAICCIGRRPQPLAFLGEQKC